MFSFNNLFDDIFQETLDSIIVDNEFDLFIESPDPNATYIIDELYPKIAAVLDTPQGDRTYKRLVGDFIDRNGTKLNTPGPQFMIPFGDKDKESFYRLFNFDVNYVPGRGGMVLSNPPQVDKPVSKVISMLKGSGTSDFKLLKQNPMFWIGYCCIRYYNLKKDERGLNTALVHYALMVYPSIFSKYFKYEVSNVACMQYTVDHLTNKFIFKAQGTLYATLFYSISNSYKFLTPDFKTSTDLQIVRFIQRIRNDQNSLIKKICDQYQQNLAKGLYVKTIKDDTEETSFTSSDGENNTSIVESITKSITLQILSNGVELKRAEICTKIANNSVSISDCRYYLSKILVDKYVDDISKFIESVLFLFLYMELKKREDINSSYFLTWSADLFRKTNSNDNNIKQIKYELDKWSEDVGIHAKFHREASRVNYKKAIFFYFILSIQAYNN